MKVSFLFWLSTNEFLKNIFFVFAFIFIFSQNVFASESSGTILTNTYSTSLVCSDATCTPSLGHRVNWKPTVVNNITPITIIDGSGIRGQAWGERLGWVNFSITATNNIVPTTINVNTGAISGYAWAASSGGLINFAPSTVNNITGVSINSVGEFVGSAWVSGTDGGFMRFDCSGSATSTCVKTDWIPVPFRPVVTSGGGGGSIFFDPNLGVASNTNSIFQSQTGLQKQPADYSNDFRADMNDSGRVDIIDFNSLLVNWGKTTLIDKTKKKIVSCTIASIADINCDGNVDVLDFNLIIIHWGQYVGAQGELLKSKK